jgi:hypothetical protein
MAEMRRACHIAMVECLHELTSASKQVGGTQLKHVEGCANGSSQHHKESYTAECSSHPLLGVYK